MAKFLMALSSVNYKISGASDPLLSQMLSFRASEGLFVQWKQKWCLFMPCNYYVGKVGFWDVEGLVCFFSGGDLQFCLGGLSQSCHPI